MLHHHTISKATTVLILLLWIQTTPGYGKKSTTNTCPIGFTLVSLEDQTVCFRRKDPERFEDIYKDCTGNLFTTSLYKKLDIIETNAIWTEYKTLYPGGNFAEWPMAKNELLTESDVTFPINLSLVEEMCLVIDPVSGLTAARCNEEHYRYCIVEPYPEVDDMSKKGCKDLKDSRRFTSPYPTCLSMLLGVHRGPLRATWRQAQELCAQKGGSLLNKGWRYSNNPWLNAGPNATYPLGVIMSSEYSVLRYDTTDDNSEVPQSEWYFDDITNSSDTFMGALHGDWWYLVNTSYIFFNVLCERPMPLKVVSLNLTIDKDNDIKLRVNDTIDPDHIKCFTDSTTYYPVKVKHEEDDNIFKLDSMKSGYYWCVAISNSVKLTESNRVLYIKDIKSLKRKLEKKILDYAIVLKYNDEQKDISKDLLSSSIRECIQDYTKEQYLKTHNATDWDISKSDTMHDMIIMRWYLEKKVLVHLRLGVDMLPMLPGACQEFEVVSMKPVYACKLGTITLFMGESINDKSCVTHTCVGDFYLGVQLLTTATDGCYTPTAPATTSAAARLAEVTQMMPTIMPSSTRPLSKPYDREDSSEEYDKKPKPSPSTTPCDEDLEVSTVNTPTEVITVDTPTVTEATPTIPPSVPTVPITRPSEKQLQQVLEDLDSLVNNDTVPILVENINDVFDQVDGLLEVNEDLEIPGKLLHLLDQLGATVELNGSKSAVAVRNNIALLMADARPDHPVRGLSIAARYSDEFTDDAFNIITNITDKNLSTSENELVVSLPASLSGTPRRISFVVFRNDRAFLHAHTPYAVNSRVLSVNVEDLTHFEPGEVIDIHIKPLMGDPDRNASRACAYWHFLEDGTGYWSQDGCVFIRSEDGLLDTCRCDHLTHFAEILVPRAVFTERHEDILELLSIIGCCLSIFGLILVGVTACLFRSWRRDFSNKIWLQLCIAIFFFVVCFLVVVFAKFDQYNIPCMLIGVALHYSLLASFCWMLVAAVLSYRRLVLVFTRDASHKLLRASAFSWGAPCVVVGILLSIDPQSYAGRFEEKTPSGTFCYPSGLGLWLAVYAPIALMLLANWTLFALIVRSVFASRRIQRHGDSNEALRCASVSCLLVFLFGLPWIFGLFAYNIVAAYLFTITANFQGFILFIFFVLGNKKTRDLWLNKLKIKQTRKVPVTSSTFSNRSTGPGWRAPATMEAKASKPRSLSSEDDSKFS